MDWSITFFPPASTTVCPQARRRFSRLLRAASFTVAAILLTHGPVCRADDPAGARADAEALAEPVVFRSIAGSFGDLRERVVLAIEGRGLSLGHTSRIGEMLDRTGRDLGIPGRTFLAAEVIEFCSSALSREVTAADPRFVAYCPYAITVYELASEPGRIWVGYRRPLPPRDAPEALRTALARADVLLEGIVREALE